MPALLLALALVAAPAPPRPSGPAAGPALLVKGTVSPRPPLSQVLLDAVAGSGLLDLHDAGPVEGRCPGDRACPWPLPRLAGAPHLDLAVIRLDGAGRAVEAANVLFDPASPAGRVVALDRDLRATGVRFRRWSPERRDGTLVDPFRDEDDLSPLRRSGADFMAPYPASLFKLLLAFHVERRAAEGVLDRDEVVVEAPPVPAPGEPPVPAEALPLATWLERMVTESDNRATKAVLRHLHARDEVAPMNREFVRLGLDTLRVDGTLPWDGGRWAPGEIHATAMDVARLLWLVAGGPGVMWRTPSGEPVTRQALPEPARQRLQALLSAQAVHEALSTGSRCGEGPPGIPALVPARWLDPATGQEFADGEPWGHDVRPCNDAAQVRFLHKTGLTWNYASDAGLVEALPGKPFRRYIVAVVSAAGTRFVDPDRADATRHPCDAGQVCVTQGLANLGAAIDAWAVAAAARDVATRGGRSH